MKKIYSVLMASAVALSASALSIETAELGAVQDFTLPEGLAPAKTLSVNTPVKYAPAKVAKTNFTGKNFINAAKAVNPRSRVLGGFEGNVADYYMFTYVDYFEKEQFCSSQYEITITKEATADADAEVAVSGVLPSNVNGVQPLKGTMASNGEITLPFGQILLTQKSGTTTRQYVFEAATDEDEAAGALYFTYDSANDWFVTGGYLSVAVKDNGQHAGYYCIFVQPFFSKANGAFLFPAQQQGGQAQQLGMDILAIVQHDDDSNADICFVGGISPFGDSLMPYFEVKDNTLVALNSKCFQSPNFGSSTQEVYYDDFMLASYDEATGRSIFPVVATYDPEMGINQDTNEKTFDVYVVPNFEFVDPYLNLDIFNFMGYYTADGYFFFDKGTVSGIEDAVAAPEKANARYYNIQGMEVKAPAKGQIVIEKAGDTARKIVY